MITCLPPICARRIASFLPAHFYPWRPLYVFARAGVHEDYAKVVITAKGCDVGDLKEAVIKKLNLGASANHVRLLKEVEGGQNSLLDSCGGLLEQGVGDGSKVIAEVLASPPPHPYLSLARFPNVLACPPDSAHCPQLLHTLSHPATEEGPRLAALHRLLQSHGRRHPTEELPLPLFNTTTHLALLHTLVAHANQLAAGDFVGINGPPCRTLVGARGIGKSALLRAFARVSSSAFPTLITLYVSGAGLADPTNSFAAGGLHTLIEAAAAERGAPLDGRGSISLNDALRAKGLRVLVLVDEVDELYRVSDSQPVQRSHILHTLGRLGTLGDGTSGLFGVLLCGSSSSTHSLVCGGYPDLKHVFPLLKTGVPDLNFTKFSRKVVPSSPCTAVGEVASMLAAFAQRTPHHQGLHPLGNAEEVGGDARAMDWLPPSRLFAFFMGSTPRAVCTVFKVNHSKEGPGAELAANALPATNPRLSPRASALYHALLAKLVDLNDPLRCHVRRGGSDGNVSLSTLMDSTVPWETLLVPLSWADVEAVWGVVSPAGATSDTGLLRHLVHEIADHQLLQLRGTHPGDEMLWPITGAQVAATEKERLDWFELGLPVLKELLGIAGSALNVAKLAAQVGVEGGSVP